MSKYRLPRNVLPKQYDLYLYPDLDTGLFKGTVTVSLSVVEASKTVVLHAKTLNITSVNVKGEAATFVFDQQYEIVTISKKDGTDFTSSDDTLTLEYNGDMKNRIVGLYTSTYTGDDGKRTSIATSKFEPTYARQAFPCFDEPNMKASYVVHLLKPKTENYIALSNYPPVKNESYDDKYDIVTFEETVPMSTYLSCFIVSDFTSTETTFKNNGTNTPLRVFASPGNLNKTTYAGRVAKAAIEFYVDYFRIPYPLPKLDMVAIPDFVSGAMEHWGLVTYRETALLYTDSTHSSSNKQRVTTVVAHELAHSWFGNLVTMNWWNDLWLNEGFASYIEYKGADAAEPTWQMMTQFLTGDMHSVLSFDASLASHPIVVKVTTPDEITSIFDSISYNKGACILRMLENTVNEKNFQKGVTNYLNKYKYQNAVTQNFLDEIQAVVGNTMNIMEIMDTFTIQTGYPVLTVVFDEATNSYTLTQKRFLKNPNATYDPSEVSYNYRWSVPVTYVTDLGKSETFTLFPYNNENITISKPEGATWLKFNHDQVGYYRVNYQESEWRTLIGVFSSMGVSDRTHLLEESFSIAEAGLQTYEIPLDLSKQLANELDYTTWSVGSSKLQGLLLYLKESAQYEQYKAYIRGIVNTAYENFTWTQEPADSHLRRLTRVAVLTLACAVDHEACLNEAQQKFEAWIADNTHQELSQDLRGIVYKYGMVNANETTWNKLLEVYKAEQDASEKLKLVYGLASIKNSAVLTNMLKVIKNETVVRGQDYFTVLGYISGNPEGTALVWDFVRNNWEYLVNRFTLNDRYLGSLIPTITSRFVTEQQYSEMEAFFAKYPDAGAGATARKTALENVKNNINWLARHKGTVESWIKNVSQS